MYLSTFITIIIVAILWGLVIGFNSNVNRKSEYLIIGIFALIFIFVLASEYTELFCPVFDYGCKNCGDGQALNYIMYKPTTQTTPSQAITNINGLIVDQRDNVVTWRKYFIISALISFLVFVCKPDMKPLDMVIIFLAAILTQMMIGQFYQYHFNDFALKVFKENVNIIKRGVKS